MTLYHGSHCGEIKELVPHKSYDGEYVYATSDLSYAIVRSGIFNDDLTIREDYLGANGYELVELYEGAFKKTFNTNGWVYIVKDNNFVKGKMVNEYITTNNVKILDKIYIPNILEVLRKNSFYKMIYYGTNKWNNYWKTVTGGYEGYLQRRKERILKLRKERENGIK